MEQKIRELALQIPSDTKLNWLESQKVQSDKKFADEIKTLKISNNELEFRNEAL